MTLPATTPVQSALNGNQGGGFLNVNWVEVTEKLEDAGEVAGRAEVGAGPVLGGTSLLFRNGLTSLAGHVAAPIESLPALVAHGAVSSNTCV